MLTATRADWPDATHGDFIIRNPEYRAYLAGQAASKHALIANGANQIIADHNLAVTAMDELEALWLRFVAREET